MSKHRMSSDFYGDSTFKNESSVYNYSSNEEITINPSEESLAVETVFDNFQAKETLMEVCNCRNVNVRAEPSGSSKILSVVPRGFKCVLLEDNVSCDFYKVRDIKTGDVGFIKKEYMKQC